MAIRLIFAEADAEMAANVGGPVAVNHKSFDVELPQVEAWLDAQKANSYIVRTFIGIEYLPAEQPQERHG